MKKYPFKKRFITLVEMMIVMFLIAMITGVIAYNYTGSLDEGKAFKTKSGIDKIQTILDLHLATNPEDRDHLESRWQDIVSESKLVKNSKELMKDGWGGDYQVYKDNSGEVKVKSDKYEAYKSSKGSMFNK